MRLLGRKLQTASYKQLAAVMSDAVFALFAVTSVPSTRASCQELEVIDTNFEHSSQWGSALLALETNPFASTAMNPVG